MFWIQNIQMKRLKELEERNRALNKQLKQLRKQLGSSDKKVVALEEENRRQREVIDKYDEKWKRLERSAREKMKQRQSLSRTSSMPAPAPSSATAIPNSLSEGSGLPIIAIPALSSSPSSSGGLASPGSSPISSPLSSSPSTSFLLQAASSSLLSPSSSLFLHSSISDDAGRGSER
jgi:TolA-binding protein